MQESVNKDRFKYLGGSDIPIIMELSPFKTRFDLLLEKAEYKEDHFEGNIFTEYGNQMEANIRDFINANLVSLDCKPFKEGKHIKAMPKAWGKAMSKQIKIRAHTDGENDDTILEVKTTSQIYDELSDYRYYLVQLLFYMMVTGKKKGLLAVYERPDDLSLELDQERLHVYPIHIEDHADECANIIQSISRFLEDLEKVKSNPFITEEELLPMEIPELAGKIIAFEQQLALMKEVEKKIKRDKERLKNAMQASGIHHWESSNGYKVTLIPDSEETVKKETSFNAERFMKENPELWQKYMEEKNVIVPSKKGYVRITIPKEKSNEKE